MAQQKPLLIPWLRDQIDSGRYPGVQWTNSEQTAFSIPWKHALRQDSSDTDVLIFKAWAEVSGNGRAQGEPSVWKRNFRSALRAKGFVMLSDKKNDAANPHKIFFWPEASSPGAKLTKSGSQVPYDAALFNGCHTQESQLASFLQEDLFEDMPEIQGGQDIIQECLTKLKISPDTEGFVDFEPPAEQQQLQSHAVIGAHPLPGQQQDPVMFEGAAGETGLPEQPACPAGGAEGGVYDESTTQFLHTISQKRDEESFKTHFKVLVYYRGMKVFEQEVANEAGVCLVYRPGSIGTTLDHNTGLSLVYLPSPENILDSTQLRLTQKILDNLGQGLDVGMSSNVIFGQRQGEIKAYWSFSKFDNSREPREIPKQNPEALYFVRDFVQGIIAFSNGGESPPCSLFFCLGEKWPDPNQRPWDKKLVTVEVVLTSMELLKNMAVSLGASSLQSVELQVSLEQMMELY